MMIFMLIGSDKAELDKDFRRRGKSVFFLYLLASRDQFSYDLMLT